MAPFERSKKPYSRPTDRSRGSDGEWLHDMHDNKNAAPAKPTLQQQTTNNRVIVTNLHYELSAKDLTSVFGQVGTLVREPLIRYDRSGRSSGVAIVTYEVPEEAARAITQFNGATANGQVMTVEYDKAQPHGPRQKNRAASAPASLLNRIQKPALIERLGNSKQQQVPTAPAARKPQGAGPIRTKPARAPRAGPKKPKTAEELDKELDFFMKDDSKPGKAAENGTAAAPATEPAAAVTTTDADVDMS